MPPSSVQVDKQNFVGTRGWLFVFVNFVKIPLLFQAGVLNYSIMAAGIILGLTAGALGVFFGKLTLQHMSQTVFERLTWVFIGASAVRLLFVFPQVLADGTVWQK
jgi:uncharacterized membrane protein YfcA